MGRQLVDAKPFASHINRACRRVDNIHLAAKRRANVGNKLINAMTLPHADVVDFSMMPRHRRRYGSLSQVIDLDVVAYRRRRLACRDKMKHKGIIKLVHQFIGRHDEIAKNGFHARRPLRRCHLSEAGKGEFFSRQRLS